jgi:DNA invertase Pin-like site-specific DNA recombinase
MRVMTGMRIGYAQVSSADQQFDLQQDEVRQAGCEKIVVDRVSGMVADRLGLARVRDMLRPGDMLVVWRVDGLGRGDFQAHAVCLCARELDELTP